MQYYIREIEGERKEYIEVSSLIQSITSLGQGSKKKYKPTYPNKYNKKNNSIIDK